MASASPIPPKEKTVSVSTAPDEQAAGLQADRRDDREQRVAQDVPAADAWLVRPLDSAVRT